MQGTEVTFPLISSRLRLNGHSPHSPLVLTSQAKTKSSEHYLIRRNRQEAILLLKD